MFKFLSVGAAAAAVILSGASAAFAGTGMDLKFDRHVYHVAACAMGNAPGTARCHARVVTDNKGNFQAKPRSKTASGATFYVPSELRAAYNITGALPSVGGGTGAPVIAIVDAYGYTAAAADLATYRSQYGLGACTVASGCLTIVNQTGGTKLPTATGSTPQGWDVEQALDLDMASAMCPQCNIVLVQANSASFSDLATAANYAASIKNVVAVSNSYGGAETGSNSSSSCATLAGQTTVGCEPYYNHPGIAVTVSSGDQGYAAGPQFPASSPHVIAVGGTTLTYTGAAGRGYTEAAWADAGSGCSTLYGKLTVNSTVLQNSTIDPFCANRTIADVSAVADPNTGVAVYLGAFAAGSKGRNGTAGFYIVGGTSAAAPLVAGIYGYAKATNAVTAAPNGASTIYASASATTGASPNLNDVATGTNGGTAGCGGTAICTARAGYDGPTGLGTPNGPLPF